MCQEGQRCGHDYRTLSTTCVWPLAVTPTKLTVEIDVAPTTPTGTRNVTVTNPDTGTTTKSNALKIT